MDVEMDVRKPYVRVENGRLVSTVVVKVLAVDAAKGYAFVICRIGKKGIQDVFLYQMSLTNAAMVAVDSSMGLPTKNSDTAGDWPTDGYFVNLPGGVGHDDEQFTRHVVQKFRSVALSMQTDEFEAMPEFTTQNWNVFTIKE